MHYQRFEPFPPTTSVLDSDLTTFHRKALLQDRVTDLEDLIRDEVGQAVSQGIRKLVVRVLSEIKSWLKRGEGEMAFEAQTTLSNMAYNRPTICNQSPCKV